MEIVDVFAQSGLVVFDREDVVGLLFLDDVPRRLLLRVQSVGADHAAFDVEIAKQRLDTGDLVGLARHRPASRNRSHSQSGNGANMSDVSRDGV